MFTKICPFISTAPDGIFMCQEDKCRLWDEQLKGCVFMRLNALQKLHEINSKLK